MEKIIGSGLFFQVFTWARTNPNLQKERYTTPRINTDRAKYNRDWAFQDFNKATFWSTRTFNAFIGVLKPSVVLEPKEPDLYSLLSTRGQRPEESWSDRATQYENVGLLTKNVSRRIFTLGNNLAHWNRPHPKNLPLKMGFWGLGLAIHHVASRIAYAVGGVSAVATRVADLAIGLVAAVADIFSAPLLGGVRDGKIAKAVHKFAMNNLAVVGVLTDLNIAIQSIRGPHVFKSDAKFHKS